MKVRCMEAEGAAHGESSSAASSYLPFEMLSASTAMLAPSNGRFSVSSSKRRTPRAHTSDDSPYGDERISSGER